MVGDYRLLATIGEGSYAKVLSATKGGRDYALKEQRLGARPALLPSILRESAVIMTARHPCIIRGQELLYQDDKLYTVMELGKVSLATWLKQRYLLDEGVDIAFEILSALAFLHRAQIIHGDLKPQNVVLMADGTSRLIDFGLSVRDYGQRLPLVIQTIWWRAPEVLAEKRYGTSADMWSFGLILYQLLTRTVLFTETEAELLQQLQPKTVPPFATDTTDELQRLINGCLQIDPAQRLTAEQALASPLFHSHIPREGSWVEPPARTVLTSRVSLAGYAQQVAQTILERYCRKETDCSDATLLTITYSTNLLLHGYYRYQYSDLTFSEMIQVLLQVGQGVRYCFY